MNDQENYIVTISQNEPIDKTVLTLISYLELDFGGDNPYLIQKLLREKRELCEIYLNNIAQITGMKRKNLNHENVNSENMKKNKRRKTDFMVRFETEITKYLNSNIKKEQPKKNEDYSKKQDNVFNNEEKFMKNIKLIDSTNSSYIDIKDIKDIKRRKVNKGNERKIDSLFITKILNNSNDSSENISNTVILKNKILKKNHSQEEIISFNNKSIFSEDINSIFTKRQKINNSPSQISLVDYKEQAKKSVENNKKFLIGLMKQLNNNEKNGEILEQIMKVENFEEKKKNQKIFELIRMRMSEDDELVKLKKTDNFLNSQYISSDKNKEENLNNNTNSNKMFEQLDKSAKINPDILYKYRFNILQNSKLQFNGNDIIFSVPKSKNMKKLPPITENKNHKYVAQILEKTRKKKFKVVLQIKNDILKKELTKDLKEKINKGNSGIDLFNNLLEVEKRQLK